MSGCGKPLSHGRPANDVVEYKGSEATPPLPSNTPAPVPSNTPNLTPEPQPSSGTSDTGSSVGKYFGYAFAVILSAIAVYGGYSLLYRFADFRPISSDKLQPVRGMPEGYKRCYLGGYYFGCYFFDCETKKFVEEIPVVEEEYIPNSFTTTYYYKPNSLMPNLLKTLLRKILRIKIPVPEIFIFDM